jgi:HNH endonuclease
MSDRLKELERLAAEAGVKLDDEDVVDEIAVRVAERFKRASGGFPESVVTDAFKECKGKCQCKRDKCDEGHGKSGCLNTFDWNDRGNDDDDWNAHHWRARSEGGTNSPDNCEIVCVPCHQSTDSYGRH